MYGLGFLIYFHYARDVAQSIFIIGSQSSRRSWLRFVVEEVMIELKDFPLNRVSRPIFGDDESWLSYTEKLHC